MNVFIMTSDKPQMKLQRIPAKKGEKNRNSLLKIENVWQLTKVTVSDNKCSVYLILYRVILILYRVIFSLQNSSISYIQLLYMLDNTGFPARVCACGVTASVRSHCPFSMYQKC